MTGYGRGTFISETLCSAFDEIVTGKPAFSMRPQVIARQASVGGAASRCPAAQRPRDAGKRRRRSVNHGNPFTVQGSGDAAPPTQACFPEDS